MSKGSQLSQLKSALNNAGLGRQPSTGKKRKHSSSREYDKDKKAKKIQEIHAKLNPFDLKVTKLKHDVPGRRIKGVTGRPQESRQAGIDQRKKTLLAEFETKGRAGGLVDRRFGENDPTMAPEERMLERFTKERQRTSRGSLFNLEDEDDLTHYGQSLSMLDDFDATGLDAGQESDDDGRIDKTTVAKAHFGGFDDEGVDDDEPARKKTKAEVMQEVMAKSKHHKFERQAQRQEDSQIRHQLDQELDDIRGLLFADPVDAASSSVTKEVRHGDKDYDQHVRELALDKRAQPKDRTKTEEEAAVEAKEGLEKAERRRLKRMRGESDSESEDETTSRRKGRRRVGGDDLDDDFAEGSTWEGLGAGLGASESEDEGAQIAAQQLATHDKEVEDEDGEEESDSEESEGEEEDEEGSGGEDEEDDSLDVPPRASHAAGKGKAKEELPFTFACPSSLDELLDIVENVGISEIPTVIQRIRTLYHPSLDKDNKHKLQTFLGVMIDYILHCTSPPTPLFSLLPPLLPHLNALVKQYPIAAAEHFVSKLKVMQKNLARGLSKGPSMSTARTWPGPSELAFFWMISHVWPTSDMNHHVISPARLLMGAYLGLCRIRSTKDICSGLFLCTLFLQYEEHSRRYVPEVTPFLSNTLLNLGIHKFKKAGSLPSGFPCPDVGSNTSQVKARTKAMRGLKPERPDLSAMLCRDDGKEPSGQAQLNLLALTIELLGRFADLYKSLDAFVELIEPASAVIGNLTVDWASEEFKKLHSETTEKIQRLLKFARLSKRQLALQAHKPIPIATYIPKFASSSSSYLRQKDPDDERAAASKLRYEYKQERKGAIRELRKDARFLSAVQHQKQQEKDKSYTDGMNKVFSGLQSERAEQKEMEREKAREKRRSGRK